LHRIFKNELRGTNAAKVAKSAETLTATDTKRMASVVEIAWNDQIQNESGQCLTLIIRA